MKNTYCYISFLFATVMSLPAQASASIDCHVRHKLFHGDFAVTSFYEFIFDEANNTGVLKINGKISAGDKKETLSRNIYFDYVRKKDVYFSKSREIKKIPIDNASELHLSEHYPHFFYMENEPLTFTIKKFGNNSYTISFVNVPLFLCTSK